MVRLAPRWGGIEGLKSINNKKTSALYSSSVLLLVWLTSYANDINLMSYLFDHLCVQFILILWVNCAEIFLIMALAVMCLIQFHRWLTSNTCKQSWFLFCTNFIAVGPNSQHFCVACRNVGHNQLNGQLSDMFQKLPKLKTLLSITNMEVKDPCMPFCLHENLWLLNADNYKSAFRLS